MLRSARVVFPHAWAGAGRQKAVEIETSAMDSLRSLDSSWSLGPCSLTWAGGDVDEIGKIECLGWSMWTAENR